MPSRVLTSLTSALPAEPEIRGDAQPFLAQGEQQDEQDGTGGRRGAAT